MVFLSLADPQDLSQVYQWLIICGQTFNFIG